MRLFMTTTFFIYMHHPLWIMAAAPIAVMLAARYTAGTSGRYRICPSLARELSYTSKRANSFVTMQIVRRRPLQSSQVMRCSATEDAPVDVKGR